MPACGPAAIIVETPAPMPLPLARLALPSNRLHLWLLALDPDARTVDELNQSLSREERERAARFRHPDDVRRYTVARGALRWLIGRYLGLEPAALCFEHGPHGKPALARDTGRIDLQFNLSHSGDVGLAGFSIGRAVGVDLEHTDRAVDAKALAVRICSPREQALLAGLPAEQMTLRFIELWTCKEAWLKAVGSGISGGPAGVDVDLSCPRPCYIGLPVDSTRAEDWSLALLQPARGLTAAAAIADASRALGDPVARATLPVAPGLDGECMEFDLQPRGVPISVWP